MRVVYIHTPTADLTDGVAAAIAGAQIVQDSSVDRAGLITLLALLAEGNDLLVPKIGHLGATVRTALASLRRAADVGVWVSILQDGLDGATILRIADLLESLPNAGYAPSHPRPRSRAYGRAPPALVAEVLFLSAAAVAVRKIATTVGLSVATVNPAWASRPSLTRRRIRRPNRQLRLSPIREP